MEKEKRITVKMPESLHKAVRLKAVEQGRYVSDVVREFFALWVEDEIELPSESEGENPPKSD
jgi:Arc/MetJ-type ribon-helix-helix transcriptional regulator